MNYMKNSKNNYFKFVWIIIVYIMNFKFVDVLRHGGDPVYF